MAGVKGKEVAPVEEPKRGLVLAEGLDLSMIEGDTGYGVDNMSAQDVALPFLTILQAGSPQVKPETSQYIEGAVSGMLYNTVSGDVFDGRKKGGLVVPCAYERKFVEWMDRDKGGGWINEYDATSDIMRHTVRDANGRPRLKSNMDHLVIETAYHYTLFQNPETEEWEQCVFTMKGAALKVNKKFNNDLVTTKIPGSQMQAPRWLFPYQLNSVAMTKNQYSWWDPKVERQSQTVSKEVYVKAKEFAELVKSGFLKRGTEPTGAEAEVVSGESRGTQGGGRAPESLDDDIPF